MNSAPAPIPPLALAALTIGVLLAHAVVVQNTVGAMAEGSPASPRVLLTRTVQLPAPVAAAPVPPAPLRKVAATQRKRAPNAASPSAGAANEGAAPAGTAEPAPMPQTIALPEPSTGALDNQAQAPVSAASAPELGSPPADVQAARPPDNATSAPMESTAVGSAGAPAASQSSAGGQPQPPGGAYAPETRSYTVPAPTRLKFDATGMRGKLRYSANGELAWLHDGTSYEARLQLSAFLVGSRVVTSTGTLTTTGLAPKRYGDKFRSETAAHFERDRGRVVFSANTPEAVLLPGAQDQLSVFLQLAAMLAAEPQRYPPGSTISMQTVGTRIAEPWTFTIDAAETLTLPGGEQQSLRLTRLPRREYDQKVEIWLAPALAYLPARIRITQSNGDFIDQQWRSTETP
jgi:hypothetical protein